MIIRMTINSLLTKQFIWELCVIYHHLHHLLHLHFHLHLHLHYHLHLHLHLHLYHFLHLNHHRHLCISRGLDIIDVIRLTGICSIFSLKLSSGLIQTMLDHMIQTFQIICRFFLWRRHQCRPEGLYLLRLCASTHWIIRVFIFQHHQLLNVFTGTAAKWCAILFH